MRKIGRTRRHIRYFACALAAVIGLLPPCAALAAQEDTVSENDVEEDEGDVTYITAFEPLAEEDAYLSCMEKPDREELEEVFPETLLVWTEGEEEAVELEVDWESEEDFEETELACYVFYPEWDETQYRIADSVEDEIEIPTITVEVPADEGMIPDLEDARNDLQEIIEKKSILALVYLCEEYEVKSEPDPDADTVHTVGSGQSVQITDVGLDESGSVWYQTLFYQNEEEYTGYIEREYLAASDEDFVQWEESYIHLPAAPMRMMRAAVSYPDVDQFPASYQNALYELKKKHPNWIFVRMNTGIDWNRAISKELGDKSLVPSSSSGSWQTGVYGQGWSYASEGILKYYMDPRNFLTDPAVFQFEQLTYNDSYHTAEAVQEILKNSFMSSAIPGDSRTYAQAFNEIGKTTGVSPFHLASRVLQEQGTRGTSALISGAYPGYEGYYNYFNVSASGKTNAEVIQNGLKKAVEQGWNTRYKSLNGGAYVIGKNYILKGQDTLYLEKFNVSNGYHANFTHQYMQNIQAPGREASNIRKAYNNAGALENSFVFKIPVFNNMPASACSQPGVTDTITLDKTTVSDLEVGKTVRLTPYVNGSKVDYISDMTFASDDSNVATVDSAGKVTAVSPGSVVISCTGKSGSTAVCTVTVVKAKPDVTTPSLSPCIYKEGLCLSDISLPEGWSWVKADTKIEVGTHTCEAVYTPEDTVKYDTVTKNISFTVTKTVPVCTMPEEPRVFVGATLGDITLPSGFAWESDAETELQEPGEYTFYVSYNPDENNYHSVRHIPFVVRVIGEASNPDEDDDDTTTGGNTDPGTGDDSGTSTGGDSGTGTGDDSGTGTGSDSSTGTGAGSSTGNGSGSGTSTGTGSGSGGGTGTGDGSSTGTGSGAGSSTGSGSGGSTGTGSGSSTGTGDGSSTGSGSSSGTSTGGGSGTGTGSGSSSGTGTGGDSSTGTGSGSGSGTSTGAGSGTGSGSGSGTSTGTGDGSSTGTGGGSSTGTGSGSGSGTSTGAGAPLKDLPDHKTSTAGSSHAPKKEADSSQSSQGGSDNSQPTQNGTDGSQSSQSGSGSGQPVQNGSGSGQPVQSGSGSSQPTQNGSGSGQPAQNGSAGSQPSQNETGAGQSTQAEHKTANGRTEGKETKSDSQTEVTEERQTQEEEISRTQEEAEEFSRPAVTMEMEDFTILTPEMLQMAREQNFDLTLDVGEYAKWSVAIDSVDMDTVTEVDMGISLGTENVPTELIAAILDGNKYLEFTLAHDGPFGFQTTLQIAFDPANAGRYANLFYYNPEEQALEFICDVVIDENGIAAFPMEHASSYVIIVSDTSMAGVTAVFDSESHETPWLLIGVIVCAIAAGLGCGVFFWRKKTREEEETSEDEDDDAEEEEEYEEEAEVDEEDEIVDDEYDGYDEEGEFPGGEDDWIEDADWQEPETSKKEPSDRFEDDHAEDDWIDDDEWDIGNDWIEDAEWEKRKQA